MSTLPPCWNIPAVLAWLAGESEESCKQADWECRSLRETVGLLGMKNPAADMPQLMGILQQALREADVIAWATHQGQCYTTKSRIRVEPALWATLRLLDSSNAGETDNETYRRLRTRKLIDRGIIAIGGDECWDDVILTEICLEVAGLKAARPPRESKADGQRPVAALLGKDAWCSCAENLLADDPNLTVTRLAEKVKAALKLPHQPNTVQKTIRPTVKEWRVRSRSV